MALLFFTATPECDTGMCGDFVVSGAEVCDDGAFNEAGSGYSFAYDGRNSLIPGNEGLVEPYVRTGTCE